jgi:hypothetical protein
VDPRKSGPTFHSRSGKTLPAVVANREKLLLRLQTAMRTLTEEQEGSCLSCFGEQRSALPASAFFQAVDKGDLDGFKNYLSYYVIDPVVEGGENNSDERVRTPTKWQTPQEVGNCGVERYSAFFKARMLPIVYRLFRCYMMASAHSFMTRYWRDLEDDDTAWVKESFDFSWAPSWSRRRDPLIRSLETPNSKAEQKKLARDFLALLAKKLGRHVEKLKREH